MHLNFKSFLLLSINYFITNQIYLKYKRVNILFNHIINYKSEMVTFTCENCFATLKKQQVDKHCTGKCKDSWFFTCIECGKTFGGYDYKEHNECMTEI